VELNGYSSGKHRDNQASVSYLYVTLGRKMSHSVQQPEGWQELKICMKLPAILRSDNEQPEQMLKNRVKSADTDSMNDY
jgi:hypothetical protein